LDDTDSISRAADIELSGKSCSWAVFYLQSVQYCCCTPNRDISLLDVEYFIMLDLIQTFAHKRSGHNNEDNNREIQSFLLITYFKRFLNVFIKSDNLLWFVREQGHHSIDSLTLTNLHSTWTWGLGTA
jgi:hypothetical protein